MKVYCFPHSFLPISTRVPVMMERASYCHPQALALKTSAHLRSSNVTGAERAIITEAPTAFGLAL